MPGADPYLPPAPFTTSSALLTDRYELTMLDAALKAGIADRPVTFEVFSRRLGEGRTFGVVGGIGRFLDALERFRFGPEELGWLKRERAVSDDCIDWLSTYRFSGNIDAYAEGDLFTAGSPVMTVEGGFGEAVLLETLVLSTLNHDSAIASAAALIVNAAGHRPLIEMGSRRVSPEAAVAAARAAYLAGFASTSNLEAGRRYGIPTAGTAAHAFTLAFPSEAEAFAAQVAAGGVSTTLLVDTYDVEEGIRTAIEVAGTGLDAIRIDSGDLGSQAAKARRQLDELGATATRIVVTGDLDDQTIAALADAPVDAYGVGTRLVTGLDWPTAGFVYKLVAVAEKGAVEQHPVAKRSPGKATVGGRKWAWRLPLDEVPGEALGPDLDGPVLADIIRTEPVVPAGGRALVHPVVEGGDVIGRELLSVARDRCRDALAELDGRVGVIALRT